jgi:hypothetical protein
MFLPALRLPNTLMSILKLEFGSGLGRTELRYQTMLAPGFFALMFTTERARWLY